MRKGDTTKKSILVTGSSSGIGKAIAVFLAEHGYTVLATVRRASSVEDLKNLGLEYLMPLHPLDLTNQDQIDKITDVIKGLIDNNDIPPLYAVVHAAGGGSVAPVELMGISGFKRELETRLVGPVALLQNLIPLLRITKGRIVWIATPGLFPIPFLTDIHAPDFAVNYIARTLDLELLPDGIKNILIRCGGIKTPSVERTEEDLAHMLTQWPKETLRIYEKRLSKTLEELKVFDKRRSSPDKVAAVVLKAIETRSPRTRYQVGYMSKPGAFLEKLPQSWVDAIMRKRES